ncbi:hypothetical protein EDD17DRAFT_370382 [Pisolithus thermaeus]|nr:hypothetical protein EV401DRAFT_930118 [Pisolithus croceorrhizus]KAI6138871.1 hypothetical protein EDD17DRAFT_370382 [Pisolithus thermaeus]
MRYICILCLYSINQAVGIPFFCRPSTDGPILEPPIRLRWPQTRLSLTCRSDRSECIQPVLWTVQRILGACPKLVHYWSL